MYKQYNYGKYIYAFIFQWVWISSRSKKNVTSQANPVNEWNGRARRQFNCLPTRYFELSSRRRRPTFSNFVSITIIIIIRCCFHYVPVRLCIIVRWRGIWMLNPKDVFIDTWQIQCAYLSRPWYVHINFYHFTNANQFVDHTIHTGNWFRKNRFHVGCCGIDGAWTEPIRLLQYAHFYANSDGFELENLTKVAQ